MLWMSMIVFDHQQHIKAILLISLALAADCLDFSRLFVRLCVGCPPRRSRPGKTLCEKAIIVCLTAPRQKPDNAKSSRELHLRGLDKALGRNTQLLM